MLYNICYGKQHILGLQLDKNKLSIFFKKGESKIFNALGDFLLESLRKEGLNFFFETDGSAYNHYPDWHQDSIHIRKIDHLHLQFDTALEYNQFKKIIVAINLYQTSANLRSKYEMDVFDEIANGFSRLLGWSTSKKALRPYLTKKQLKEILKLARDDLAHTSHMHKIYNLFKKQIELQEIVVPQSYLPPVHLLKQATCPLVLRHAQEALKRSENDAPWTYGEVIVTLLQGVGLFATRGQQPLTKEPVNSLPGPAHN